MDKIYTVFCWYCNSHGPVWLACAPQPISATLKQCKQQLLFNSQPSFAEVMSVLHRWPVIWPSELICKLCDHSTELFIRTNFAALKWKSANLFTSLLSDGKEHSFALERAFGFQGCKQCVWACVYVRKEVCVPRLSEGMKMPSAPMGTPLPTLNTSP